jgi:Nitroreductase
MAFIDLAKDRYSVRKFSAKPVEKEKLDQILQAGQIAPTAGNTQPQRILVVEDEEAREKIKKCTPCHFNAPVVLIVCYDNTVSFSGKAFNLGIVDASIVATHLMLEVADIGLGATWVENFEPDALVKEFSLPENLVPVALLPLGYPAEDAKPAERHTSRKPLDETVFYNHLA